VARTHRGGVDFTDVLYYGTAHNRLDSMKHTLSTGFQMTHYVYNPDGSIKTDYVQDIYHTDPQYVRAYQYDALGRKVGWYSSAYTAPNACAYDPDGRMFQDCNRKPLALLGDNIVRDAATGWSYIHAPGVDEAVFAFRRAGGTPEGLLQFVTDGRGQLLAVADSTGGYNETLASPGVATPGEWVTSGLGLRLQTFDAARLTETDSTTAVISSFRTRQYDPATGRWQQEDHAGLAGGVNLYQFNGNDPNSCRDPFGDTLQSVSVKQKNDDTKMAVRNVCVDQSVAQDLRYITDRASAAGIPVVISTAYRDRDTPASGSNRYASMPGKSEHLSGFAFDVRTFGMTGNQMNQLRTIAGSRGFRTGTDEGHYQNTAAERRAYKTHGAAVAEATRSYQAGECSDAYVEHIRRNQ
jgi:RHS repeat-associated protein